jgi:4-amino-4-deoxy-L-arabinose transferase-like glycosyltransferase
MFETVETIKPCRATLVGISLVVVIGAVLRFHNLGGESLFVDEAGSWAQAKDGLIDLIKRTANDNYPPLHNLVLFAVIKVFGDSEWTLRLPSALFGIANIGLLYWLATMTVGRAAGLIGAVLLAVAPFHLYYSQEGRMYALLALAATLYAATCFHYLRGPSFSRGAWMALAGLLLVYSHPYGTLDWIAIALAFAMFVLPSASLPRRALLIWKLSNVVIATGFAPWALILAYRAGVIASKGFWIPPLTVGSIREELEAVMGGWLFTGVILVGVALGIVGRLRREVLVLYVWILAPIAIGIVASILSTPVFLDRYLIGSLPPLFLLAAFGWTKHAKDWRGVVSLAAVFAIAGLVLSRYQDPYYVKDDLRSVASFLDGREQAGDCVLVVPAYNAGPLDYYRRNSTCQWGALKITDLPSTISASVLFGIFEAPGYPNSAAIVNELRKRGWHELDQTDFRGVRVVSFTR